MLIVIPSVGTPAHKYAANWIPSYRQKLAWKLKKFAGWVAEVTFGCRHSNITLPFNDHQTCLDCGASRLYLYNTEMYLQGVLDAPVFIGRWKKATLESVDDAPAIPGSPAFVTPDQTVYARTERVMERMKIRAWFALALCLVAIAGSDAWSQLPDAPRPQSMDRAGWALFSADVSFRTLDTVSTRLALTNPCQCIREMFLPGAIVNHTASLAAFEGGIATLNFLAARNLTRHHHGRLAKLELAIDASVVAPWAIHNLSLGRPAPHALLTPAKLGVRP